MKKELKLWISAGTFICMLLFFNNAFSQNSQDSSASAKSKQKNLKDKMPVIVPESNDSISVIRPNSKDPMPRVNPDTVGALPKPIRNTKKKRLYKNSYNYPSLGNHFGDNRIKSMVGRSDTRSTQN
jgi:hypothetical protein